MSSSIATSSGNTGSGVGSSTVIGPRPAHTVTGNDYNAIKSGAPLQSHNTTSQAKVLTNYAASSSVSRPSGGGSGVNPSPAFGPYPAMEGVQAKRRNNNLGWNNHSKKRYNYNHHHHHQFQQQNHHPHSAYNLGVSPPASVSSSSSHISDRRSQKGGDSQLAHTRTNPDGGGGGKARTGPVDNALNHTKRSDSRSSSSSYGSNNHHIDKSHSPPLSGKSATNTNVPVVNAPVPSGKVANNPVINTRSRDQSSRTPPIPDPPQPQKDVVVAKEGKNFQSTNSSRGSTGSPKDASSASTTPSVNNTSAQGSQLPPTHYPNELLKIIRDNMQNYKESPNIWALLNNFAAPLIIKNGNSPTYPMGNQKGSPNTQNYSSGNDAIEIGLKETAILQAMEQNLINNNAGYELLANAILSNGGLIPNYLSDPVLTPFSTPPPVVMSPNTSHGAPGCDNYAAKVTQSVGSPVLMPNGGSGYMNQQHSGLNHTGLQNMNFQRMPGGDGHPQHGRHQAGPLYNVYHGNSSNSSGGCPSNNASCANYGYNQHPFIYNGHYFYPRPKNFWNFCVNCKKSQFCYQHTDNCNSSAFHGGMLHNYITFPGNHYAPDYYHRPPFYYSHYGNPSGGIYNHHGKRNGRRHFNGKQPGHTSARMHQQQQQQQQQQVQETASNGSSTPNRSSCAESPKVASPTPPPVATVTAADQQGSATKVVKGGGDIRKSSAERKDSVSGDSTGGSVRQNVSLGSSCSSGSRSLSAQTERGAKGVSAGNGGASCNGNGKGGKKRWQQSRGTASGGYESDNSRSNGDVHKFNYGLLQNMKLWHTEAAAYKREQLLAGELGAHQLMSPTNHRYNQGPLIGVLDGQGDVNGELFELTTTQPVIHEEELDSESAYWSSVFPFTGTLDEGVEMVEEATPADKYLANAHLVEMVETPKELIEGASPGNGSVIATRDTLSQQVWNTFLTVQQTQETYRTKLVIWKLLYACIKKVFPKLSVFLVGSTITGFGAETSDVDMCVVSHAQPEADPRVEAVANLTDLKKFLSASEAFENFHLIQAKVPILRFRDTANQIEVDLNYNNSVGIRNTHLLYCYSKLDWRVRPLVLVVKLWAKYHDINNAKNMTISSYSLALMVIHFLQCGVTPNVLPCLHSMYPDKFESMGDVSDIDMNEDLETYVSENNQTLGELLLRFLYYYSHFDYNNFAISVRTGSCLFIDECRFVSSPKNDPQQWKNLCIEEPFDFTNTARSVYDVEVFHKIKYVFVKSYEQLQRTLDLKSILNDKFVSFPVHNYHNYHNGHRD